MPAKKNVPFLVLNALMGGMFFLSAALQWNDPDPWAWIATYVAAGVACFLPGTMPKRWLPPAIVGCVCLVWAVSLAPETLPNLRVSELAQSMKAETPSIELGREMLGLLILAIWMAVLLYVSLRRKKAGPDEPGLSSSR